MRKTAVPALLALALAAALPEQVLDVAAVGAHVLGHVLDQAQHRHVHLLEHPQRLASVERGHVLRCGHHDRTGDGDLLRHRQLDVARAGGQVHDEEIQPFLAAPQGVVEQLHQGRGRHRTAPDHRRVLIHQKPDRHGLDPVRVHRQDRLAVRAVRPTRQAEHGRDAGTVHIGVEHAHARTTGRQGQGEIHRGRGLADAALAGTDRDDIADPRMRGQTRLDCVGGDRHGVRFFRVVQPRILPLPSIPRRVPRCGE